jgi:hypothetical protein
MFRAELISRRVIREKEKLFGCIFICPGLQAGGPDQLSLIGFSQTNAITY